MNTSPFKTQAEAVAYALGYNFGYMAAKLDSIEKSMDRLLEAASTPEQVAFEKRCADREEQWKDAEAQYASRIAQLPDDFEKLPHAATCSCPECAEKEGVQA